MEKACVRPPITTIYKKKFKGQNRKVLELGEVDKSKITASIRQKGKVEEFATTASKSTQQGNTGSIRREAVGGEGQDCVII